MTIKEFSNLCGCNPQTIRYYDRMNLLKPVKVDDWTGYRFYDEEQALDFVKIKNLQTAGFSIDEIKGLLNASDEAIYDAFSQKIKEQEENLKKMIEIRESYQNEITMIKNKIRELHSSIKNSMETYSPAEEFGISIEEYNEIVKNLDSCFNEFLKDEDISKLKLKNHSATNNRKVEKEFNECLSNPDLENIFETHGWKYVKDFYSDMPEVSDGEEYYYLFKLDDEKSNNTAFANTFLGIQCLRNEDKAIRLQCKVIRSDDDQNHFWLLRKKSSK